VLRYLARYTHRVAISNRRLIACDEKGVTFKWKDYRIEGLRAIQGHDTRDRRVHPPFPDACIARRLSPHPLLRPARDLANRPRMCRRPNSELVINRQTAKTLQIEVPASLLALADE
jgi:hypothetical protein